MPSRYRCFRGRSNGWLRCGFLLAGLTLAAWTLPGFAKVDADPNNEYLVTPEVGPWMVLVQSFQQLQKPGDSGYSENSAHDLAHALVLELRSHYNLRAFVFNRGKVERDKQAEELNQRREQQRVYLEKMGLKPPDMPLKLQRFRIDDQYAVLVGGYKDMDAAHSAMVEMRKLPPPSNKNFMNRIAVAGPDPSIKQPGLAKLESAQINPFQSAFVVPNPTVPTQKAEDAPDPLLKKFNSGESFSLLKCSKPWTLAVKEFYGGGVVVQKSTPRDMIERLLGMHGSSDTLNASAMQAHEIAKVLREKMNMESYVLHTRYGSIVTVGGYDKPDDPRLMQNQQLLANLDMGFFRFFARPMPMKVPKF